MSESIVPMFFSPIMKKPSAIPAAFLSLLVHSALAGAPPWDDNNKDHNWKAMIGPCIIGGIVVVAFIAFGCYKQSFFGCCKPSSSRDDVEPLSLNSP